jgi:hypothetical protein
MKISDHCKPAWQPKFKWARNDYQIFSLQNKKQKKKEAGLDDRIKVLRRKQFFNFLADFFDKLEDGQMKAKVGKNFAFSEEEKEKWL